MEHWSTEELRQTDVFKSNNHSMDEDQLLSGKLYSVALCTTKLCPLSPQIWAWVKIPPGGLTTSFLMSINFGKHISFPSLYFLNNEHRYFLQMGSQITISKKDQWRMYLAQFHLPQLYYWCRSLPSLVWCSLLQRTHCLGHWGNHQLQTSWPCTSPGRRGQQEESSSSPSSL